MLLQSKYFRSWVWEAVFCVKYGRNRTGCTWDFSYGTNHLEMELGMLNWLWAGMILIGIVWAGFHGNLASVTEGALNSAKEAIELCIVMAGVMGMWTGLMKIATKSGLLEQLNRRLRPVINFLFPYIPKNHKSREYISTNFVANMLGLGWAATPAGLQAMEELAKLEEERAANQETTVGEPKPVLNAAAPEKKDQKSGGNQTASDEMCTFLVLNISSLQLIPVNIIAYRTQYGSGDPAAVVGPALIATSISTIVGILFCKLMCKKRSSETL